jgi:hypothetical protein
MDGIVFERDGQEVTSEYNDHFTPKREEEEEFSLIKDLTIKKNECLRLTCGILQSGFIINVYGKMYIDEGGYIDCVGREINVFEEGTVYVNSGGKINAPVVGSPLEFYVYGILEIQAGGIMELSKGCIYVKERGAVNVRKDGTINITRWRPDEYGKIVIKNGGKIEVEAGGSFDSIGKIEVDPGGIFKFLKPEPDKPDWLTIALAGTTIFSTISALTLGTALVIKKNKT